MATPFDDNPAFRKITYKAQWVVNGILALLAAYFAATTDGITDFPEWYLVITAVAPVLWTYLGVQADANVKEAPPFGERGAVQLGGTGHILNTLGIVLLVVAVILLLTTVFGVFVVTPVALIALGIVGLLLVLIF